MALDTETKRRRALRSVFGLGLKGHSYLVADGDIAQIDRAQIIGFYFPKEDINIPVFSFTGVPTQGNVSLKVNFNLVIS